MMSSNTYWGLSMNDEAPRKPLTASEQIEAERLLKAFLDECPLDSMPSLRLSDGLGAARSLHAELLALINYCYHLGWDDGYFDGRADACGNEEDYGKEAYE